MKFLAAAAISAAMLLSTAPAKADNSEEVIIGILGGALGGLIVGEALGSQRRPVYVVPGAPQPYYNPYDPYVYDMAPQPECYAKWVRKWDSYNDRYIKVKKVICN